MKTGAPMEHAESKTTKRTPGRCEPEGYPGIAHDLETLRFECERLRAINAELLAALEAITNHFADVMAGPMVAGRDVTFANGVEGIPTIKTARDILAKAKGE